jgi:uncharacterized protein YkwD
VARGAGALGVVLCLLGAARGAGAQAIDTSGFAGEVFQLLNQQRAANGLPALYGASALDSSAQSYAEAMKQATAGGPVFLSHTGPDGSSFQDRINSAGYNDWTTIGENIAAGQKSPQEVVDDWMNSPGHRENILNPAFQDIGIGLAVGPGTWPGGYKDPNVIWWVTDFGSSRVSSSTGNSPAPPSSSPTPAVNPTLPPPTPSNPAPGSPNPSPSPTPAPNPSPSPPPVNIIPTPGVNPSEPGGIPAAVPTTPRSLVVTAFGALGNGIADDSPAIQAALEAAQAGDHIVFPAGTYRLGATILVRKGNLTVEGDGAGSVIQNAGRDGFQLGAVGDTLSQLELRGLRFVGLPGRYRLQGNTAVAIKVTGAQGAFIHACQFDGSGIAVWDAGAPGALTGTHLLNCQVNGWGSSALVLTGGERVESCALVQDDPDRTGRQSDSAVLVRSGSTDVQISGTSVANSRVFAVQVGGDGVNAVTAGIQFHGLTANDCRAGIVIGGGASNPAPIQDLLIEGCAVLGAYDGASIWIKQIDGGVLTGNIVDGGPVGLAVGLWGDGELNGSVTNLRVEANTFRNCDRGIWAESTNGGTVAEVGLPGNTVENCRVPVDLGGLPGVSLLSPSSAGAAPAPTVAWLADGLQQPITRIQSGHHFLIRGSRFGTNGSGSSRVLFLAGSAVLSIPTFIWSDDTIGAVAPSFAGLVYVVVQVEINGMLVTSNRMPLVVQ